MTTRKHNDILDELKDIIPHMGDVKGYRDELKALGSQWDLLTLLGQISGTESDMSATQKEFQSLNDELLGQLGMETLKKTIQKMSAIAQVAVDILIRNLFERTADIGFLATDKDIREFLQNSKIKANSSGQKNKLIERFREYVAKYSVYYNIILMDTEGTVLAQLDQSTELSHSSDPLIQEALLTDADFVEVFRHTDLDPKNDQSLIYAYRVTEDNDSNSTALGVLCLCFRFENEVEGIFSNLLSSDDWAVVTILDAEGQVIASSDPYQIPHKAKLKNILHKYSEIVRFAGRQYLAKTFPTKGYQGFFGLGWQGHVMLPLNHAFESNNSRDLASLSDDHVLDAVMQDPQLFSNELREIPLKADAIQKDLDRTVWNGNVRQTTAQSKALLWNISATGERTKQVFESSIGNLHQTVVSTILDDVLFQSALAVDIMDRNLYERANDCRWWALTSAFRSILSQVYISSKDAQTISDILKYINDLYTVYSNLFVYDTHGKVIAVSNPSENRLVGQILKAEWVGRTLGLKDSQSYCVSEFEPTFLYNDRYTYVYGASIAALGSSEKIVGGIGIVFDSTPQFKAMLEDSLPRDEKGHSREDVFAVFCDNDRRIISSSTPQLRIGEQLDIDHSFFKADEVSGKSSIVQYRDKYYAVGSRKSKGYREYKNGDHYRNDVTALVFAPLANVSTHTKKPIKKTRAFDFGEVTGGEKVELATFIVDNRAYAFRTEKIQRAIDVDGLTPIPGSHKLLLGKIHYNNRAVPVVDFKLLTNGTESTKDENCQIIIIQGDKTNFGIMVDALGPIPSIPRDKIDFNASLLDEADNYTEGVILPLSHTSHREMIILLDANRMLNYLATVGTFVNKKKLKVQD
jgi:chemotaxis signal transduction protein